MENNRCSSNKKCLSSGEEKLIREVDYELVAGSIPLSATASLNLEISQKVRRVVISIKPTSHAIKTLFTADKDLDSTKGSEISASRLGTGDFTTYITSDQTRLSDAVESSVVATDSLCHLSESEKKTRNSETTYSSSSYLNKESNHICNSNTKHRFRHSDSYEKCYIYIQPLSTMGPRKVDAITEKPIKADKTVIIVANNSSKDLKKKNKENYDYLRKRLNHIENKVLQQEMVIRCMDSNSISTGEEEGKGHSERGACESGRPGCSYIEQYSHVPETSAFHRNQPPVVTRDCPSIDHLHQQGHQSTTHNAYTKYEESAAHSSDCSNLRSQRLQRSAPLTPDQTATIDKGHNSEQYGRHFTTYDGITARGKRHSASVPVKRIEVSTMAAERVQRIRQKLNPVRDYRLMDTVHYLAQGEFAPRDDGIKLTPSREAVLSDIVWEDVCRTHWPNARLSRRNDRNGRGELQRQIDNLLRERVAHVERRRRRHYKIIKLNNHRHENCKPVGKTGDIIVASHKNNSEIESLDTASDRNHRYLHSNGSERRRIEPTSVRKTHNSHEHLTKNETTEWHTLNRCECAPGPSSNMKASKNREASCYFHTYKAKPALNTTAGQGNATAESAQEDTVHHAAPGRAVAFNNDNRKPKHARMVMKKDISRRKHRDDTNLDHFILLPTLVARTPSNIMRQKKFNALYHRILKIHIQNQGEGSRGAGGAVDTSTSHTRQGKKDIGCNINISPSDNED